MDTSEIKALANQETPKFFNKVKQGLLNKWNGMKVKKAHTAQVDGVTGATYSSKAVKENVKRGISYYLTHWTFANTEVGEVITPFGR